MKQLRAMSLFVISYSSATFFDFFCFLKDNEYFKNNKYLEKNVSLQTRKFKEAQQKYTGMSYENRWV